MNAPARATLHHSAFPLVENYGPKARIGLLVLSTDPSIERDFHRLAPNDDVGIFTTRIYLETPNSDRTLSNLQSEIEAGTRLLIPDTQLDAVVFGCTSGSTLIGPARIEELVHRARPEAHVTNPATGVLAALNAVGARKVALVAPYTVSMTENVTRFLEDGGIGLTSVLCTGYDTDVMIGSVSEDTFLEAVRASDLSGADAIFLSCTATRALSTIEQIEAETGLPVIVSNQAAFWHALKLTGWNTPISGFGRLLRDFW